MLTSDTHANAARSTPASSRHVDLFRVLRQTWGIEEYAAALMIGRGGVSIDGHCVSLAWARGHWTEEQLYGRMLKCSRGEVRLFGSRLVRHDEQLEL